MAVIGVLYDTLLKISTLESNSEAELSRIMSVLGDPSRFNIVLRLAKQKSYGRELAKLLNITPGAVSQHLSILMSTGLIESNNIGNRVYYSLNNKKCSILFTCCNARFRLQRRNDEHTQYSGNIVAECIKTASICVGAA